MEYDLGLTYSIENTCCCSLSRRRLFGGLFQCIFNVLRGFLNCRFHNAVLSRA